MKQYTYNGPPVTLGRFGAVKPGDALTLTEAEEKAVLDNKDSRFKPLDKKSPKGGSDFKEVRDGMSQAEIQAIDKHNRAEEQRIEGLRKANESKTVRTIEIRSMDFNALVKLAEEINTREGKLSINFDAKKTSKPDLANMIIAHEERKTR